ncbi:hypothetical protein [Rhodococcoides kyotonense]|uniref:Uncharacterized protein n=1 Tax=Rhodococcoides kyotonense TaxID=398843 RepID=A0A177YNR5_9NOCA|nr:hypothetical protein [Rhodococcus kyotonensis]OAK56658.1 hypothetical protein A3K89_15390 [Rhodococcus kyotonensis]
MTENPVAEPEERSSWRAWRPPAKLFGRIRTSTAILSLCFVLTGLLYNQLQEGNDAPAAGPTAVDPGLVSPGPSAQQEYTEQYTTTTPPAPTTTVSPTPTDVPTTTSGVPGAPGTGTSDTGTSTTTAPTYLPGLTVPPELRSLLPAPPTATGTP